MMGGIREDSKREPESDEGWRGKTRREWMGCGAVKPEEGCDRRWGWRGRERERGWDVGM